MKDLQDQLTEIESKMSDGNFVDADGKPLAGQEYSKKLLHSCLEWTELELDRYV